MEGQKVSVSVMGLKQDVTSGMEWVPNDLEENQIRSVLEETCGNKTVSGRSGLCTQRFVFSKTTRKMRTKSALVTRKLP